MVQPELLAQARAGDDGAFEQLIAPYRRELHVHCYRILGSAQDAEDVLQEALLAAWQALVAFEERSSLRTWLYRISTNRCLNALRSAERRPQMDGPLFELPVEPTRHGEVFWLEPYPDALFDEIADDAPGPEARYDTQEAISLAFVTALQLLPPRQRAVLILRDVLGFHGREVAEMLDATEESVASALKRARQSIHKEMPAPSARRAGTPESDEEREALARFTAAFESRNVDALVELLTEDAWLRMPPVPLEYQGRDLALRFFRAVYREDCEYRLVPTRANNQPAFGVYVSDPVTRLLHASGLIVVTIAGHKVSALTRFDNTVLANFGLPRTLPARDEVQC